MEFGEDDDGYHAFSSTSTQERIPCDICGRNFNPDALNRHIPICERSNQKKRKVFDASKQRAEGTEIVTVQKKAQKTVKREQVIPKKKNNWRQKHEEFIRSIRGARGVQAAIDQGKPLPPPPPPTVNPDYVQCQYCDRRFNETAAERHIPFCKEQHERLPKKKAETKPRPAQYKTPKLKSRSAVNSLAVNNGYGSRNSNSGMSPTSPTSPSGKPPTSRTAGSRNRMPNSRAAQQQSQDVGVSGRALRTGRTAETYTEARQLSASQRKRYPSNENIHKSSYNSSRYSSGYSSPSSGGRNGESGYYSGNDDLHIQASNKLASSAAKFCHECGTRYPVSNAKFCCECGIRRMHIQ